MSKKKIRPGAIVLAQGEQALVVEYDQEEFETQDDGSLGKLIHSSKGEKKLKVKSLGPDLDALANELMEKCKLIKPSSLPKVKELLGQLQQREESKRSTESEQHDAQKQIAAHYAQPSDATAPQPDGASAPQPRSKDKKSRREKISSESKAAKERAMAQEATDRQQQQAQFQRQIFDAQAAKYAEASMDNLEAYMEQLYEEDIAAKVSGLGMLAQLFRDASNFETLLRQKGLLPLLARTLREEGKKSMDLAINAVSIFFSVSNFSQFHGYIMDNQVGAMTVDLVALEVQRTAVRTREHGMSPAEIAHKVMEANAGKAALSDKERKLILVIQKQDRLLYLCLYLLLNLAEDAAVEKKMRKRAVVPHLLHMLERANVELLILAATFLKKLSIYRENVEQMSKADVIVKLNKFVPVRSAVLMMAVLRLLHNLSFDSSLREQMVAAGLVPKLVALMAEPRYAPVCMGILYHVSMGDTHKSLFVYTDAVPLVYNRLVSAPDLRREPELIALAVNLTQNAKCAAALCEGGNFEKLMRRAVARKDDLLFKVDSLEIKRRFSPYVEQCVVLLKAPDVTPDLFVEVLGTLANLAVPEFDFQALAARHDLVAFLAQYAAPGAVDDDILLEVIMFLGVLCTEGTAAQIDKAGLPGMLFQHMGDKKEDDEFVLQITFTFAKLLAFAETRATLLRETDVVHYLVDLLQDKNKEVRKHADRALDIVMDADPSQAPHLRELKFSTYNQEWLEVAEASDDGAPSSSGGAAAAAVFPGDAGAFGGDAMLGNLTFASPRAPGRPSSVGPGPATPGLRSPGTPGGRTGRDSGLLQLGDGTVELPEDDGCDSGADDDNTAALMHGYLV